ncbi:MAG: tetratricopeptide repeat protein, partial [Chlamydiia bacterium]|nr:tetratricopeptide repeat protein [Chlamydiia bacterium]
SLYLLLVVLDHSRAGTWVNLGIAEHLGGKLNRALNAFALATWEAPEDPVPSLHLADCYIECDRIDDAVRALSMAAESVGEDPNHKRLREQAEQLRKALVTKHAGKVKRGGNG